MAHNMGGSLPPPCRAAGPLPPSGVAVGGLPPGRDAAGSPAKLQQWAIRCGFRYGYK